MIIEVLVLVLIFLAPATFALGCRWVARNAKSSGSATLHAIERVRAALAYEDPRL